jgi:signal transduction histidine kinase
MARRYFHPGAALTTWRKARLWAGVSGPVPLLVFCIIGLLAFELWRSYTMTRQNAERSVQNLTHVIAEQTARTIQSVDLSLQSIVHDLEHNPALADNDAGFRADLLRRLAALPYVRALFVIEPDGYISHDSDFPTTPRVSLADRTYFRAHQYYPAAGLYISHPLQSRSLGIWFSGVSRRIEAAGGGFGGVVVAAMEPLYFEQFYRQLWVGDGTIALFLEDGALLARSPRNEGAMRRHFASLEPFRSRLKRHKSGVFWSASPIDGVDRLVGYRKLDDAPIVATVSLDEGGVMRPWVSHATALVIGAAILLAVLVVLESLSRRHRRREEMARTRLEEARRLETIGRFSSGMAHDLGNLERIVRSAVLLLRPAVKNRAGAVKLLDEIDLALASARDMINQLLARGRSGELRPEPVDVGDLMERSLPVCRRAAGAQVRVKASLGSTAVICSVDPFHLQAALVNLIINSRDAMPDGGTVRIDLRTVDWEANERWAQISVSDDGPGMPRNVLKHAFDPFFTTKQAGHGNGLGLSQVRDFVWRSGGKIELNSAEGDGTTVHMRFPLAGSDHGTGDTANALAAYEVPADGEQRILRAGRR